MNKYKNILILLLSSSFILSEGYNMQLLSHMSFNQESSDITGFYQDEREFAVMGLQNAAVFIDITDPSNPFEISRINGSNSIWRDIKYWNRHVYIGTEADDGIKIVSVDNPDNPTLVNTITDIDNSHNIHVDSDGFLYIIGADEHDIWIYDLDDPENPFLVGTWDYLDDATSENGYCHDIEVYNDKLYCAAIYVGYFHIIDISDKSNPTTLASHFSGIDGISTHDVAVTEDERYLFTGDENLGGHIKVWDIQDYNNINLVDEYITINGDEHSAHNLYVRPGSNQLIISYYADGTRILDISDPTNLEEIAYYDMSEIEGLYVSNWGVYAYLPSGLIISSDIEQGLYVFELGGVTIMHDEVEDVNIENDGPYVFIEAEVESFDGYIEEVVLNYSLDNIIWNEVNMYSDSETNLYNVIMTFDDSGVIVYYYITASNNLNQYSQAPDTEEYLSFVYGNLDEILFEDFESENNWYVESTASDGLWELGIPNGSSEQGGQINELDPFTVQPYVDHTVNGEKCYLTGNEAINPSSPGQDDVDGGYTILYTDIYNLSEYDEVLLSYWRWYTNNLGNSPGTDIWSVQATNDDLNWVDLENTTVSTNVWTKKEFILSQFIDFDVNDQVRFRFSVSDLLNDGDTGSGASLVEGAVDDFKLEGIIYQSSLGDINFDGSIDVIDIVLLVNNVLDESFTLDSDINNDGLVNVLDVVTLVNLILD